MMKTITGPLVTLEDAEQRIEVEREKTRGWRETANRRDQYLQECQAELNELKALIQKADEAVQKGREFEWAPDTQSWIVWVAGAAVVNGTLLEALEAMVGGSSVEVKQGSSDWWFYRIKDGPWSRPFGSEEAARRASR